jgi:hypothetical protein
MTRPFGASSRPEARLPAEDGVVHPRGLRSRRLTTEWRTGLRVAVRSEQVPQDLIAAAHLVLDRPTGVLPFFRCRAA